MNRGQQLLYEYDEKIRQGAPAAILEEANGKIADMVKAGIWLNIIAVIIGVGCSYLLGRGLIPM